jgi:two-component system, NarL family, invasion response regulator UvrY
MEDSPVRVLIVDDQAPFRRAARSVVSAVPGFQVVAEADGAESAIQAAAATRPSLVLMDIRLGEASGIEVTQRILADVPDALVILVSTYAAEDLPAGAGSSGAAAYLHKEQLGPVELEAIWSGRPTSAVSFR